MLAGEGCCCSPLEPGSTPRVASYLDEVDTAELRFSYLFGLQGALTDTVRVEMQDALG